MRRRTLPARARRAIIDEKILSSVDEQRSYEPEPPRLTREESRAEESANSIAWAWSHHQRCRAKHCLVCRRASIILEKAGELAGAAA